MHSFWTTLQYLILYLKGLGCRNENIENQHETCLQIDTYVGLIISFLDSNYSNDSICRGFFWRQNTKLSNYQKTNVNCLLPQ